MEDKNFEIIYHTADVGVKVWGKNLKELFKNSALALFNLISDVNKVDGNLKIYGSTKGEDTLELLVNFLNEIIFLHEKDEAVFRDIKILIFSSDMIEFELYGEKFDTQKHVINYSVKACTYHKLKIININGYFETKIIFDT